MMCPKPTWLEPKFKHRPSDSRAYALHCYMNGVKPGRNSRLVATATKAKQSLQKVNNETVRYPWAPPPALPQVCKNMYIERGWCLYDLASYLPL